MERLKSGDIVSHFKRDEWLKKYDHIEEKYKYCACFNDHTYLYEIISTDVTHTETKERLVLYRALYTNEVMGVIFFQLFVRPYDMFMSEVDREKYPNAKQKYRFEKESDSGYENRLSPRL